jgi:UPF0271 protein
VADLFVVDAGLLFTTWPQKNPDKRLVTTQAVIDEVLNRRSQRRIDEMLSTGRLRIEEWSPEARSRAEEEARKTGDLDELSEQDLDLLALALTLQKTSRDMTVASTDFAVLNTAISLGVAILETSGRFRHKIEWIFKCPACGKVLREAPPQMECPVCGTPMQRKSGERRRIH